VASVFSRIIAGELDAAFCYSDDVCVAFMSINPLAPGHTLVVPRDEVEEWIDLDRGTWEHLSRVSQRIGDAIRRAYRPEKVGMMLAGLEVPHTHVHVVPIATLADLNFANAAETTPPDQLEPHAARIRAALEEQAGAR